MANGITSATKEDSEIQAQRWYRAPTRAAQQWVGYSIGRGFEADYLGAIQMSDMTRYSRWLKSRAAFNSAPGSQL